MLRRSSALLILLTLVTGCLPQAVPGSTTAWVYTDLRLIDDAGGSEGRTAEPGLDLIAVYSRTLASEQQFRLDLLDLTAQKEGDLYLALDTGPGGTQDLPVDLGTEIAWDTLLVIPASGPIQAFDSQGTLRQNLSVRVLRDPLADTVEISLDRAALEGSELGFNFQVYLAPPGSKLRADSTPPLASSAPPPPQTPVLLAFWNTLPAYSPVQALRRWDGAHTGPFGGRHGLHNLLRVARNRGLPIALLDLKTPASLAALDTVGGTDLVRDMAAGGLLILPDSVPSLWPSPAPDMEAGAWIRAAEESRENAAAYGLADSPFLFAPFIEGLTPGQVPRSYRLVFSPQPQAPGRGANRALVQRWGEQRVITITPPRQTASLSEGESDRQFSLEIRRDLVEAALLSQNQREAPALTILGGDLTQSAWGDPSYAREAMDWLVAHPWIQVLDAQDLLSLNPSGAFDPSNSPAGEEFAWGDKFDTLAREIEAAPPGPLAEAAWQAYLALFAPTSPGSPELPALRAHYAGQIGALLSAARWAANPSSISDCSQDLDLDSQPECVLASESVYTTYEIGPGSLTYLFVRSERGIHQIMGPSSQLTSGTSEPESWDFTAGLAADPAVYPGAFFDQLGPYGAVLEGDRLTFTALDGGYTKSFGLLPDGLRIQIQGQVPPTIQIPLALDPWRRFSPGWADHNSGQLSENTWTWSLEGGPQIQVTSSARLSTQSFIDSRERMTRVEDPNFEFPPGHFLPFPLSLVEIYPAGEAMVEIRLVPGE